MVELLGCIFSTIVVFLVFNWGLFEDVAWEPWYYLVTGAGLCTALFIYEILTHIGQGKKLAAYYSAVWFYVFFMFSYWALFRTATRMYLPEQQMMLQFFPSQGLICLLILTLFTLTMCSKRQTWVYWGLVICGGIHAGALLIDNFTKVTGVEQIGLLGNRSLGASFVVIWLTLLPRAHKYLPGKIFELVPWAKLFLVCLGIAAVLFSKSSISYLALGAIGAVYAFRWASDNAGRIGAGGLAFIVLALCFFTLGIVDPENVFMSSRFQHWPIFYTQWVKGPGVLFGLGPSNLQFYLPFWQKQFSLMQGSREGTFWLWLHNDWLQMLFEYGVVGLTVFTSLFLVCLKRAWREPSLFLSVVAIGAVMVGNYPWHISATTLLCTFVLWECITLRSPQLKS